MASVADFPFGTKVWFKYSKTASWPAKVIELNVGIMAKPTDKKPILVYFFGSRDLMCGTVRDCTHYEEHKEKHLKKKMSAKLKKAVEEVDVPDLQPEITLKYLTEPDVFDEPDESLLTPDEEASSPVKRKRKPSASAQTKKRKNSTAKEPKKAAKKKQEKKPKKAPAKATKKRDTSGGFDNSTPSVEERRRLQAAAAETRIQKQQGRGLKDPEGAKRRVEQRAKANAVSSQPTAGTAGPGLKWAV